MGDGITAGRRAGAAARSGHIADRNRIGCRDNEVVWVRIDIIDGHVRAAIDRIGKAKWCISRECHGYGYLGRARSANHRISRNHGRRRSGYRDGFAGRRAIVTRVHRRHADGHWAWRGAKLNVCATSCIARQGDRARARDAVDRRICRDHPIVRACGGVDRDTILDRRARAYRCRPSPCARSAWLRCGHGSWRVDCNCKIASIARISIDDHKIILPDHEVVHRDTLGLRAAIVTADIAANIVGSASWVKRDLDAIAVCAIGRRGRKSRRGRTSDEPEPLVVLDSPTKVGHRRRPLPNRRPGITVDKIAINTGRGTARRGWRIRRVASWSLGMDLKAQDQNGQAGE